tara:strand:- start:3317 stop:3640 length:324 start_codon:yes stop_codon:yes gene_type:complete
MVGIEGRLVVGLPDLFRQSTTLPGHGSAHGPVESAAACTGLNAVRASDQKASPTEVASVIETESLQQFELALRGVQGDTIGSGNRHTSQMTWANPNHVLCTFPRCEV